MSFDTHCRPWIPSRRLIVSLAASLLLHAATVALFAIEWSGAMQHRVAPSQLLARLQPAPTPLQREASATLDEPLLKNTLSDAAENLPAATAPRPARNDAAPSVAASSNAARQRAAQRKLAQHLFYPPEAVAAGIEGEVRLLLTLDAAGNVVEAQVASGSGHPALDRAAVDAAHAMRRLPGAGVRELILPVVFRLE